MEQPAHDTPRALDRRFFVSFGIQAAVVLAAGIGVILFRALGQRSEWVGAGSTTSAEVAGNGQVYTCAMYPQVITDKPGPCPICSHLRRGPGADEPVRHANQPVPRPTVLVVPRNAVLMVGENSVVIE